jgi:hypothetical protein
LCRDNELSHTDEWSRAGELESRVCVCAHSMFVCVFVFGRVCVDGMCMCVIVCCTHIYVCAHNMSCLHIMCVCACGRVPAQTYIFGAHTHMPRSRRVVSASPRTEMPGMDTHGPGVYLCSCPSNIITLLSPPFCGCMCTYTRLICG